MFFAPEQFLHQMNDETITLQTNALTAIRTSNHATAPSHKEGKHLTRPFHLTSWSTITSQMHSNKLHMAFSIGTSKSSYKHHHHHIWNNTITLHTIDDKLLPTHSTLWQTLARIHARQQNILLLNYTTNAGDPNLIKKIKNTIKEFNLIASTINDTLWSMLQHLLDNDTYNDKPPYKHPSISTNNHHDNAFPPSSMTLKPH